MITEDIIITKFNEFRSIIGRAPDEINAHYPPGGVTYSHFKAAFLMANYIDLKSNGFSEENWLGNTIEGAIAGEDLL